MVRTIDELTLHDSLFAGVTESLKRDIANGMSALDIAKKYSQLAAARTVTVALTDEDSGKALAASKDLLDRTLGKPTERKELVHSMANASEEEIDALIASKMREVEEASDGEAEDK
jgi:cbb3-type cytochrome oxidase cytochrome c subunit